MRGIVLERRPERPALHAGMGEAMLMSGKRDIAVASFRRGLNCVNGKR